MDSGPVCSTEVDSSFNLTEGGSALSKQPRNGEKTFLYFSLAESRVKVDEVFEHQPVVANSFFLAVANSWLYRVMLWPIFVAFVVVFLLFEKSHPVIFNVSLFVFLVLLLLCELTGADKKLLKITFLQFRTLFQCWNSLVFAVADTIEKCSEGKYPLGAALLSGIILFFMFVAVISMDMRLKKNKGWTAAFVVCVMLILVSILVDLYVGSVQSPSVEYCFEKSCVGTLSLKTGAATNLFLFFCSSLYCLIRGKVTSVALRVRVLQADDSTSKLVSNATPRNLVISRELIPHEHVQPKS